MLKLERTIALTEFSNVLRKCRVESGAGTLRKARVVLISSERQGSIFVALGECHFVVMWVEGIQLLKGIFAKARLLNYLLC